MLIWTSVVLDETELPEFVVEKIEALARSAELPIISSSVACETFGTCVWLAIFTRSRASNRSS
jgi:hypothetical protein